MKTSLGIWAFGNMATQFNAGGYEPELTGASTAQKMRTAIAEYAWLLASEALLGDQHANSGWGAFDDDNMVGATAFMETLELALELRRANYGANGERLGFDLYPYTEDAVGAVKRSLLQWNFIDGVAAKIDEPELRKAQQAKDAVRAYELVYAALGA